jgi:O-antigen/teichoic acid export membrane protein
MDQNEFGLYGYLAAIVVYMATILNGGFYLVQSKLYFEYPESQRGQVLFTLNSLLLGLMILAIAMVLFFNLDGILIKSSFNHAIDYSLFRAPIMLGIFAVAYGLMVSQYLLVSGSIKRLQLFNILRSISIHLVVITMLYALPSNNGAFLRVAGSYYVEIILVSIFTFLMLRHSNFKFDGKIAIRAIGLVMPISIYTIFSLIIFLSDRYFVEHSGTFKDLAIYNLAWTVGGIIPFISNSAHNIWLPELLRESDEKKIWVKAKSMAFKLVIGFTLVSVATIVLMKLLLTFSIINQKYDQVIPVLPLVLLGSIVLSFFQLVFNYLLTMSKIYIITIVSVTVAPIAILLAKKLVLLWGVYGAALSMVTVNLLLLLPCLFFAYYLFKKNLIAHANRS